MSTGSGRWVALVFASRFGVLHDTHHAPLPLRTHSTPSLKAPFTPNPRPSPPTASLREWLPSLLNFRHSTTLVWPSFTNLSIPRWPPALCSISLCDSLEEALVSPLYNAFLQANFPALCLATPFPRLRTKCSSLICHHSYWSIGHSLYLLVVKYNDLGMARKFIILMISNLSSPLSCRSSLLATLHPLYTRKSERVSWACIVTLILSIINMWVSEALSQIDVCII